MFKTGTFKSIVLAWGLLTLPMVPSLSTEQSDPPRRPEYSEATYPIGPGDVLDIIVWKEEQLAKKVIVPPDGVISFPLAGSINVQGKTTDQIKDALVKRLSSVVVDPVITVALEGYSSHKVYVIGQVNKPGEFSLAGPVDVMQALAMAGGMAKFADKDSITILRRVDGKLTSIPFDYTEVADGVNLDQTIILEKGDTVVVQ